MLVVEFLQNLTNQGYGISQIRTVVGKKDPFFVIDDHQLHRGGAGVDADMYRRVVIRAEGYTGYRSLRVTLTKCLVIQFAFKQRRLRAIRLGRTAVFQRLCHFHQVAFPVSIVSRTQRHEQQTVLRAGSGNTQRFIKALAQAGGEGQRAAQIQNIACNGPSLRKARNRLIHHGLIDAGSDIRCLTALIDKRLHIRLGKHSAAGGDGIGLLRILRSGIHLIGTHLQQRCHLVDKRTGATGTGAVHAHLRAIGQKQDLCILATQFDDAVRTGGQTVRRHTGSKHLLHKGNVHTVCHTHAGRAGNGQLCHRSVLLRHTAQ